MKWYPRRICIGLLTPTSDEMVSPRSRNRVATGPLKQSTTPMKWYPMGSSSTQSDETVPLLLKKSLTTFSTNRCGCRNFSKMNRHPHSQMNWHPPLDETVPSPDETVPTNHVNYIYYQYLRSSIVFVL